MEDLYLLIKDIDKGSIRGVKKFLLAQSVNKSKDNLLYKLFDILSSAEFCPSNREVAVHLWGNDKITSLKGIKSRLKKKLLDYLTDDVNLHKEGYDDADEIRLYRKWIHFQYLYRLKGSSKATLDLLNQIISKAYDLELFLLCIDALQCKKYIRGFSEGKQAFDEVQNEVLDVIDKSNAAQRALDIYYELILSDKFKGNVRLDEDIEFNESAFREIEGLNSTYKSYKLLNIYNLTKLSLLLRREEYQGALEFWQNVYFETQSIHFFNKNYFQGHLNGNYGQCFFFTGQYEAALKYFSKSKECYNRDSMNYSLTIEHIFKINFHLKRYTEANSCLSELIVSRAAERPLFLSRFQFYQACLFFQTAEYSKALAILREQQEITKDKEGWAISFRLLRIMCLIELDKPDQASAEIETLRKHMERHGDPELNQRELLILQVLRSIDKHCFQKVTSDNNLTEMVEKLASNEKVYRWTSRKPELIPFHEWFKTRFL